MKNIMIRLKEYQNNASEAEKKLIQMVLDSPEIVIGNSIQKLAQISFTSPATIIRLCKKLDCSGYKEFHNVLTYEIASLSAMSQERIAQVEQNGSVEAIVQNISRKNISAIENTINLIDEKILMDAVNLLNDCEIINFFGIGSSLLVAKDAYLKFMRLGKKCNIYDDWHGQLMYAKHMKESDVGIFVSYSGSTDEILTCAKEAKGNGANIIAITRFEATKLSKLADYNFYVTSAENIFRSGAMASRISQLCVIDILYSTFLEHHFEENMKLIEKTDMKKM